MNEVELVGIEFSIALIAFLIGAIYEGNMRDKEKRRKTKMQNNNNYWLDRFEAADEQGKLDIIWEVAHLETVNSVSRPALHLMLHWLADYTLEQVDEEE